MEEEVEALNRQRARQQRRSSERKRLNLLEKIAQPREVLIMRGSILAILVIAFALSVYSKNQFTDNREITFWDITSYRYCFLTIVIGIAYNIVALLLNLLQYFVPDINSKILFGFEFICDKMTASLIATGAAAGLGASIDLQKATAYKGAGALLNMGKAVSGFLVVAFFLAFVLSLCSSRALAERGSRSSNPSVSKQEDEMSPLPSLAI